jgi:hypothetical protein
MILPTLSQVFAQVSRRYRGVGALRRRPALEYLEDRCVPSIFTVTDLGDAGIGSGGSGDLRYAITTANANDDPGNRIVFRTGLSGTITLTQGKLVVSKPLEVDGPGADRLTVSGNHRSGVFDIEAPAGQTVMLSDLTVADGTGAGQQFGIAAGGGLFNDAATLVLERTTFSRNSVPFQLSDAGGGGAIFNALGVVTVDDSTITNNQAGMAPGVAIRNLGAMALHHATVSANPGGSGGTIANDGTMTLDQCVIADNGNDIANTGTLTMTACTVTGNTAFTGGGLHNVGRATVIDSTFRNNSSTLSGGAIAQFLGEMTVGGSTIAGNTAGSNGGGIAVTGGHLDLANSTLSGNVGQAGGGIYYAQTGSAVPVLEVTSATITLNTTTGTFNLGGGIEINISSGPARALLRNAIIAGNQAALRGPDVDGPALSLGYNLVGQTDGSTGWVPTDLQGTSANPLDPMLGPLQDNGGPTSTHALLVGSPALHAGDPAVLLSRDQRGSVRAGSFGTPTDIGAFAAEPATRFRLTAPANFAAGKPFALTVVALDQWGNVASTYTGTVHFNSTDAAAQLPGDTAFSGDDAGTHAFTAVLRTPSQRIVQVVDTGFGSQVSGRTTVHLLSAPLAYDVRADPAALAVGDFNGDGIPDIVTANLDGSVSVLLGNGDGTFRPGGSFAAGDNPRSVVAGDFRHRGILDLAVVRERSFTGTPGLSILLGNGDGTFQPPVFYLSGTNLAGVTEGDFRHSGNLDLAVTTDNGVSVLFGNGDGTFQAPVNYLAGGSPPSSIAAADLTGHGNLDLVVNNFFANTVTVLRGNGDGTFLPARSFAAGPQPGFVQVADLRRNGIPDIVVDNDDAGTVSVLLGNGDGTFRAPVSYAGGGGVIGDFTGNGILDIAGDVILLGNGDGTFRPGSSFRSGHVAFAAAVDLTGDGVLDLVGFGGAGVAVVPGYGDGTFQSLNSFVTQGFPVAEAVGDFRGNGIQDLAVVDTNPAGLQNGMVRVLLGNGDGTFRPGQILVTPFGPVSVAVGSFRGNGILDIAVVLDGLNHNVEVFLGNGDGTFQPGVRYDAGGSSQSVAVGDFTGSGILDLVVANYDGNDVSVLLGNGDGTFQAPRNFNVGIHPSWLAVGDFTGSGIQDIAVANGGSNNVSVLLGNGDGTFQPARNYPVGRNPRSVAVGDFRGNGIVDIAVANYDSRTLSVLLGNGDGTFGNIRSYPAEGGARSVAVVDFYGDGIPALAVAGLNGTRVLRGNGDGTFQVSGVSYVTGFSLAVVGGDFHGDGLPDLAISNQGGLSSDPGVDDVVLLLNEGRGAGDHLTPGQRRSPGTPPRGRIERASAAPLAQEAIAAALRAAAVPPALATGRPVDDSRPLLGRDAESLWASAGGRFTVTVTAPDGQGNTASTFTGSVRFSSSDPAAMLPADYHFVFWDGGVATFYGYAEAADAAGLADPLAAGLPAVV